MIKSLVYYGNIPVGEVEVWPKGQTDLAWAREIRVDRLSPASERCPPLAVLHVVAAGARCLVMEFKSTATAHEPPPPLVTMHTTCLKDNKEASSSCQSANPIATNVDLMSVAANQHFVTPKSSSTPVAPPMDMPLNNDLDPQPPSLRWHVAQSGPMDPSQGSPAREEGEVPESELDPDTWRRLLILQHGQDTRDPAPPFPAGPPAQVSVPPVQSHGNWFCFEDEMNPSNLNKVSTEFHLESDSVQYDKKQLQHTSYIPIGDNPMSYDRYNYQNQRYPSQPPHSEDHHTLHNHAPTAYRSFPGQRSSHMGLGRHFA